MRHHQHRSIMYTFESYNPCLTILFVVGVIPFNIKTIECTLTTAVYPIALFFVVSSIIGLISFHSFFALGVTHVLRDTYSISTYIQSTAVIFVYYLCIIMGVRKRQQHCNLLSSLIDFDRNYFDRLHGRIRNNNNHITSTRHSHYEFTIMTATIVGMVSFFYVSLRYSLNFGWILIFHIFYKWEIVTIMLMSLHMRNMAEMMTARFDRIAIDIAEYLLDDGHGKIGKRKRFPVIDSNVVASKFEIALDLLDTLLCVQKNFSSAFGIQLILGVSFYFVSITVNVYYFALSILERGFSWPGCVYFCLNTVPYIGIAIYMVAPLDKLADKVRRSIRVVVIL